LAVFHLEHEQRVRHCAVGGRLCAIVADLDVDTVWHEFDEVQLRLRVALADFLFWNRMAVRRNASLDARDVQLWGRQSQNQIKTSCVFVASRIFAVTDLPPSVVSKAWFKPFAVASSRRRMLSCHACAFAKDGLSLGDDGARGPKKGAYARPRINLFIESRRLRIRH
jgi:hypothetical protein